MYSNGNSFGACAGNGVTPAIDPAARWPLPVWKFGLRLSDDRGNI